jgi:uncharacterized delta-60 repeat protein
MRYLRFLSVAGAAFALVFTTGLSAAAGDLDTTFDGDGKVLTDFAGGSNDRGFSVAIQADGKVLVAGESGNSSDVGFALARYARNGALDPTFDGDGKVRTDFAPLSFENAYSVALQADGKIVVAGRLVVPDGQTGADFAVARYNADGALDATFDGDGKAVTDFAASDVARSVAIQSDGKIVVVGGSRPVGIGSPSDFALARYNADGSADGSFGGDGRVTTPLSEGSSDYAEAVAVQGDGKLVVGGWSKTGAQYSGALVRYMPDGSLDGSFDGDGKVVSLTSEIWDLALQPDGRILAAGFTITRFGVNGSVDPSFNASGAFSSPAIVVQSDGKIVAAGPTGYPSHDFAVARFDPSGELDATFGSGGMITTDVGGPAVDDLPYDVAISPDGKVVLAGSSGPPDGNGPDDFAVARYLAVPPPCKVPNVRGKRLAIAKSRIKKARCTVGKVTRKHSKKVKKSRVLSQSPRAGAVVPSGSKVNLVISKGRKR